MDTLVTALEQGVTSTIIIAILLVVIRIIDNKAKKNEITVQKTMINTLNTIAESVAKNAGDIAILISGINHFTKDIIEKDKEKCKNSIETSLLACIPNLIRFVISTIETNDVDNNKDVIMSNIHNVINAEYYNVFGILNMYSTQKGIVNTFMKVDWIEELENDMIEAIFNKKLPENKRITSYINKLYFSIQTHISYITNKAL